MKQGWQGNGHWHLYNRSKVAFIRRCGFKLEELRTHSTVVVGLHVQIIAWKLVLCEQEGVTQLRANGSGDVLG
jgi:hypothetical protein